MIQQRFKMLGKFRCNVALSETCYFFDNARMFFGRFIDEQFPFSCQHIGTVHHLQKCGIIRLDLTQLFRRKLVKLLQYILEKGKVGIVVDQLPFCSTHDSFAGMNKSKAVLLCKLLITQNNNNLQQVALVDTIISL